MNSSAIDAAFGTTTLAQFECELDALDLGAPDYAVNIIDLRRRMDIACDSGYLTIKEWRLLIDKVAAIRSKAPLARPGLQYR